MNKLFCLIALTFIVMTSQVTTSQVLARSGGQQGGVIGPGSVDGLQPSSRDQISNEQPAPIVKHRSKKAAKRLQR